MKLCSSKDCTGCLACMLACPVHAIRTVVDEEGFLRPLIDEKHCAECGQCAAVCPILHVPPVVPFDRKAYSGWAKNVRLRRESSSGGVFSVLAASVIERGGVVVGAAFDDRLVVRHVAVDTLEDLGKLRGSKYVQSEKGDIYPVVRYALDQGREVLFSGTPCEVAGLLNYIGEPNEKLITIDLVCHGVPSPWVFSRYREYMAQKLNVTIASIFFRDKAYSWLFSNMLIHGVSKKTGCNVRYIGSCLLDPYWIGFTSDVFLRPSCYNCQFAREDRHSDITLADWWHYKPCGQPEEKGVFEKGVSLVLVNTAKGGKLLTACAAALTLMSRTLAEAFSTNKCFRTSYERPATRDLFWEDFRAQPFEETVAKYMKPKDLSLSLRLRALCRQTMIVKFARLVVRVLDAIRKKVAWKIAK